MFQFLYINFWVYITKKVETGSQRERFVHPCPLQHIHDSQAAEANQMSVNRYLIKKMWYMPVLEYFSVLEYPVTRYNMVKPWEHYSKWNKPVRKKNTVWVYFCEVSKQSYQIQKDRKQNSGYQDLGGGTKWGLSFYGYSFSSARGKTLESWFTTTPTYLTLPNCIPKNG